VKLLFDENLSPTLSIALKDEYPESAHVRDVGLKGANDGQIWVFAGEHGFSIVSKDADFRERSLVEGFPPKIIWLDIGNAGTSEIIGLSRTERGRVEKFAMDEESSLLVLSVDKNSI
jgi:predicted nuclease of predicted toxin-antitoxin system